MVHTYIRTYGVHTYFEVHTYMYPLVHTRTSTLLHPSQRTQHSQTHTHVPPRTPVHTPPLLQPLPSRIAVIYFRIMLGESLGSVTDMLYSMLLIFYEAWIHLPGNGKLLPLCDRLCTYWSITTLCFRTCSCYFLFFSCVILRRCVIGSVHIGPSLLCYRTCSCYFFLFYA